MDFYTLSSTKMERKGENENESARADLCDNTNEEIMFYVNVVALTNSANDSSKTLCVP